MRELLMCLMSAMTPPSDTPQQKAHTSPCPSTSAKAVIPMSRYASCTNRVRLRPWRRFSMVHVISADESAIIFFISFVS